MAVRELLFRDKGKPAIIGLLVVILIASWLVNQAELFLVLFYYLAVILVQRLAASYIWHFRGAAFLRRTVYALPSYFPFLVMGVRTLPREVRYVGLGLGILVGLLFRAAQARDLVFFLSKDFVAILPPLSLSQFNLNAYSTITSAISQEIFYKAFVVSLLGAKFGLYSVVLASLLFAFEHYLHLWGFKVFDRRDYVLQVLLSLGLGTVFLYTGSIVGCILGHLIYNCPSVIQDWLRYKASKDSKLAAVAPE